VVRTVAWDDDSVVLIDQRKLPQEESYLRCRQPAEVAAAIRDMAVRGAPAIGVSAAFGIALGARRSTAEGEALRRDFEEVCEQMRVTRPTAVNLFWAIERMRRRFVQDEARGGTAVREGLLAEAQAILEEDLASCHRMGDLGAALITRPSHILTHCNAGALATAGYGTAGGVLRAAWEQGRLEQVWVDETRPLLQGARLTTYELARAGIPYRVITDSSAGTLIARGMVERVVVGADRIAANGDVANKVGTYPLAVLAQRHGVPFYVAAPLSTVDPATPSGEAIPIEERDAGEVAPDQPALNFAFDVTPAELVTAIVTEAGVLEAPYEEAIAAVARR
jgi:methylthioribose-1-phosphate isomerase